MNHRVKIWVEEEKKTLFGTKKVMKKRTIIVDGPTYRRMKRERKQAERESWEPFSIEEMMFYDWIFGDD